MLPYVVKSVHFPHTLQRLSVYPHSPAPTFVTELAGHYFVEEGVSITCDSSFTVEDMDSLTEIHLSFHSPTCLFALPSHQESHGKTRTICFDAATDENWLIVHMFDLVEWLRHLPPVDVVDFSPGTVVVITEPMQAARVGPGRVLKVSLTTS